MPNKIIKIGGASGFWGDAARSTPQLLKVPDIDYIVYDYLAEITMSIMARAYHKDTTKGYATDFVTMAMAPNLHTIANKKVKIISNAGGVNPKACVAHLRKIIADLGLNLNVATITGDDLMPQRELLAQQEIKEMFSSDPFPDTTNLQSINAYLGAFPIVEALNSAADIIVTGRCVDSAVTLAACVYSFGWQATDYHLLAAGALAGHILECGTQATGGNFTDWETVQNRHNMGYPIAEMAATGQFVCTKPKDSGGIVNTGTLAEQMLYEIGDPQCYQLPDVCCDFSAVTFTQLASDRVQVEGAKGFAPTSTYKVCATCADGFRGGTYLTFYGMNAKAKAMQMADDIFKSASLTLSQQKLDNYTETSFEIIGSESQYGNYARYTKSREVVLKIAVKHNDSKGIGILFKDIVGLSLSTPPGLSGFQGGRPSVSPVVRLFSFTLAKTAVNVFIEMGDSKIAFSNNEIPYNDRPQYLPPSIPAMPDTEDLIQVPLIKLAWGRSGDKGNKANIGIIARRPEYWPYIIASLDTAIVAERFAHFLSDNQVERFLLPGCHAVNFLLHNVLGGGGIASLRNDAQGKGYAQLLLECDIAIPSHFIPDYALETYYVQK